jgi:hypothetical protein
VHEHDGFYLRLGLGYAYLNASGKLTESKPTEEVTIKGSGESLAFRAARPRRLRAGTLPR